MALKRFTINTNHIVPYCGPKFCFKTCVAMKFVDDDDDDDDTVMFLTACNSILHVFMCL